MRDQVADHHLFALCAERSFVVQLGCAAGNEKLFRGNRVNFDALVFFEDLQLNVVKRHLTVHAGIDIAHHDRLLFDRNRDHILAVQHHRQLFVSQPGVTLDHRDLAILVVNLDDRVLLQKRRFEPVVQNLEPVHLMHKNVVDVRSRQLCLLLVFGPLCLVLDNLARPGEHPHQRRHGPLDHFQNVHQDDLATVPLFIA